MSQKLFDLLSPCGFGWFRLRNDASPSIRRPGIIARFNTSLLSAAGGYTRIDDLRVTLEQVETLTKCRRDFSSCVAT
jgi:hypothetical protein